MQHLFHSSLLVLTVIFQDGMYLLCQSVHYAKYGRLHSKHWFCLVSQADLQYTVVHFRGYKPTLPNYSPNKDLPNSITDKSSKIPTFGIDLLFRITCVYVYNTPLKIVPLVLAAVLVLSFVFRGCPKL